MDAKTYRIPIENDSRAFERISKMKVKAEKMGIPFPEVTFGEPYKTVVKDPIQPWVTHINWWRDITLQGEGIDRPVSYGGWKIIGQFNHEYPQVILNKLSDNINPDFIELFETENVSWCQDCNKKIYRHNTYVIENESSTEQMLIGSTCMHKYVPHQKSVDDIMAYYKSFQEMFNEECEEGLGNSGGHQRYHDTHQFLRSVFQVRLAGVEPRQDEFDPLVEMVYDNMQPGNNCSDKIRLAYARAVNFMEDAESEMFHMGLFIQSLSEQNEFNVRLKRMCEPGFHLPKDGKTIKWGAIKYYDYIHRARKTRKSKWVANVGEILETKVNFDRRSFLYSSNYGDVYLYSFKTEEGNTITWKTSYLDEESLQGDIIIRGRVKELTEFNGVKQTQIARAKLRENAL